MALDLSRFSRLVTRITGGDDKEAEKEMASSLDVRPLKADLSEQAQKKEALRALDDKQFLKEAKAGFAIPEEKERKPEKSTEIDPTKLEIERREVAKDVDKGKVSVVERGASPEREFAIKERESAQKGSEMDRVNLSDKKGKEKAGPEREEIMATDKEKAPKALPEGMAPEMQKQIEKLSKAGVRADQIPEKGGNVPSQGTPQANQEKGGGRSAP
ncbi:MAG: hypothetical protein K0R63_984 [Rickettsiales bacterium]|jgi:hypothetical protein|nr:hypothetical protein [Rickettsiales bacterium]